MFITCFPVLVIIDVMMANETKPKKNIILGVTLPYLARTDPEVLEICRKFKKSLWVSSAPLGLFFLTMFFVPWISVKTTILMVWIELAVIVPLVLRVRVNGRLRALKNERGWRTPLSEAETVVDLGAVGLPGKPLSAWWFIPPLAVSLVPVALSVTKYGGEELSVWMIVCGSFALTILASWLMYPLIFRQKADVFDQDTRRNAALTNVRRYNWGKTWIYITWTTALLSLAMWVWRENGAVVLIASTAYSFVLLALCLRTEFVTRRVQEVMTAESRGGQYVDEDAHWLWGMFYVNPHDRHNMCNDRVGMGMTINLARPVGKAVMILSVLAVAAMPFLGVWMMAQEFSPREAEIVGTDCVVTHLTRKFSVPLGDVTEAELLYELPKYARVSGTGMDTLQEGKFRVEGYGLCLVSFNPEAGPFIVLVTKDDTYIFSADTPQDTTALFAEIRSMTDA